MHRTQILLVLHRTLLHRAMRVFLGIRRADSHVCALGAEALSAAALAPRAPGVACAAVLDDHHVSVHCDDSVLGDIESG